MNKLLQRFYSIVYCLYRALIDTIYNDGMEYAGYLSFLILLSIFPFLIVLITLSSTFANFLDQYNIGWTFIIDSMPQDILVSLMPRIREIISGPPQSLLTLAIVGAIWTASSTIEGLRTILNKAYKVPVSPPYILRRILSILQFLMVTLIITLTIVFSTLVPMLIDFSYHGLSYTKYLLIEFILFIVVSWLYFMLPNIRQNVSDVFPGSCIAVMLWIVSASAFKQYLRASFDQLDLIYGSLGGVVVSLLFFYMVSLIFIYGAKFNFQLKCFYGSLAKEKEMGKLEGKIALIAGASGGMGSAVAKRFVREGAYVILISRSIDNLKPLYDEIEKLKEFKVDSVKLIQLDLLDFENVKILVNMIESLKLSESGALDILVACTGILGKLNPVHECELEELQNVMNTNFTANWYLLKNLDPVLKKSNSGRVVFMTSEVTLSPSSYPYWLPYAASKAALEIMVKIYASETKHTKLCVNAVYSEGPVDSEMYKQAFPGKDISELILPDKLTDKFVELASEDCSISGQILPLSKSLE